MKVVVDTNVLVSAFLNPAGPPAQILGLILARKLKALVDGRILLEYREVLRRPHFEIAEGVVDDLLAFLDRFGLFVVAPPFPTPIPDPSDGPFLGVAVSGGAEVLITGNKKDFGRPPKGLKLLNPAEFLGHEFPEGSAA